MFSTGARLFPNQPILPSSLCAEVGSRPCTCVPKPHAQTAPFYFQTFISLLLRISLNLRSSCLTLRSSWDVGYTSTSALSVPSSEFDLGIQNRREDKGLALPGCWGAAQWGPYAEEGPGLFPAAGTYYSPHHLLGPHSALLQELLKASALALASPT